MSWCAVYTSNSDKKKHKDVTFFSLPSDSMLREAWIKKINQTELPKDVYVCHKHFKEESFDPHWKMFAEMTGAKIKRKLLPGAIPEVFSYKQQYPQRITSINRQNALSRKKVSGISLLLVFVFI